MGIYERSYYREQGLDLRPDWNQRSAVTMLIIANVAIFIANILVSDISRGFGPNMQGRLNDLLSLHSSDLREPWMIWRTFTYGFVHDAYDIRHLLFNMLGLYFLGRTVETHYGRSEFFRIYLIAVVVCGILWLLRLNTFGGTGIVLGASGAVICIEMLFVFNFPTATVNIFIFPVPAWLLGVFLVLSNLFTQPSTGIAFDVHLFGIGFAALYFFQGWNFSFLGDMTGAWRRTTRRMFGPKLRVHTPSGTVGTKEEVDAAEADRILAKIHESGQDSLTSKERKFLEKYSQSVRNKKQVDS